MIIMIIMLTTTTMFRMVIIMTMKDTSRMSFINDLSMIVTINLKIIRKVLKHTLQ